MPSILLTLNISTINMGGGSPASVSPPAPWIVTGDVTFESPATAIAEMSYSVGDGPITPFQAPTGGTAGSPMPYFFSLTLEDISSDGTYLLTIYARDNATTPAGGNCLEATRNIIASGF